MKILIVLQRHLPLCIVLSLTAILYALFPFSLQALEPYSYAAAIEKYYNFASSFALSVGHYLPDFGRYHPNHPLGHVLAGLAYDYLHVPALSWMMGINAISALATAGFLYAIALRLKLNKLTATATALLFLASNSAMLAVYSGEWHMPPLALSMAALWIILYYIENGNKKYLYISTFLFIAAAAYHLNGLFFGGLVFLVLIPFLSIKERWREIVFSVLLSFLLLVVIYVVIPFLIFHFKSAAEFWDYFFIYKNLHHIRYSGLEWFVMGLRGIAHGFTYTPNISYLSKIIPAIFLFVILSVYLRFALSSLRQPLWRVFYITPILWFFGQWLLGARADALNGWLFIIPFLCLIFMRLVDAMHFSFRYALYSLALFVLGWNLVYAILPNSLNSNESTFFFRVPKKTPRSTPIAFIVKNPVTTYAEFWYAGSRLGFRNQILFLPCCGEHNYISRLRQNLRTQPNLIIVTDNNDDRIIEAVLQTEGKAYGRWLDRHERWPASRIPATVYFPFKEHFYFEKRITVWIPTR